MINRYDFNYGFHDGYVSFEVDTEKFTPELANATLEFFTWDYDAGANPIDEVLKKYAIQAFLLAGFHEYNVNGLIQQFKDCEGFAPVDGSMGIKLVSFSGVELNDENLTMVKE